MTIPEKTTEELFLEMLEKDIEDQAVPIPEGLLERINKLLGEYTVDLDEKLDDADEIWKVKYEFMGSFDCNGSPRCRFGH